MRKKLAQRTLILIIVSSLLFFLHLFGWLRPLENLVGRGLAPIEGWLYRRGQNVNDFYENWRAAGALREKNVALEQELNRRLIDGNHLRALEEENKFLRDRLNFPPGPKMKAVVSRVIGRPLDHDASEIIIDRGREAGVAVGAPAVIEGNFIIGKVQSVADESAVIRLVNDYNSELAAAVANNAQTIGIVSGDYGLGVKLNLIPQTEAVNQGDLIVTSGRESGIPRGLVIGTVEAVNTVPEEIFKSAVVKLPHNFDQVFLVEILISE
jgi:rod shape-determining protein MreC